MAARHNLLLKTGQLGVAMLIPIFHRSTRVPVEFFMRIGSYNSYLNIFYYIEYALLAQIQAVLKVMDLSEEAKHLWRMTALSSYKEGTNSLNSHITDPV